MIGLRRKRVERRLKSLLFRSSRDRLIHLLLEISQQYGYPTSEGVVLGIRLSHQDLASIIGATRETVTTLLGEMQQEGLLLIKRQKLVLLDLPRLTGGGSAKPGNFSPAAGRDNLGRDETGARNGRSAVDNIARSVPGVTRV